jgi:hypothetical protein
MIHGLPDTLRFNPININPNLTTFTVDDPSDNVTCMINKTTPHTDMFILSLHDNSKCVILTMNYWNGNSNYVSCCLRIVSINRIREFLIVWSVNTPIGLCFVVYDLCSSTFEMGSKEEHIKVLEKIEFRMTQHCATIFVSINDPCFIEFNILENNT